MIGNETLQEFVKRMGGVGNAAKTVGVALGTMSRWLHGKLRPRGLRLSKLREMGVEIDGHEPERSGSMTLKQFVKSKGGQEAAAREIGITHNQLGRWVRGQSVPTGISIDRLRELRIRYRRRT